MADRESPDIKATADKLLESVMPELTPELLRAYCTNGVVVGLNDCGKVTITPVPAP